MYQAVDVLTTLWLGISDLCLDPTFVLDTSLYDTSLKI